MPTMGVSTPQHLVVFGITSIGILSAGYVGSSNDSSDTRDGREDFSTVLRMPIGTCSFIGALEHFHLVE